MVETAVYWVATAILLLPVLEMSFAEEAPEFRLPLLILMTFFASGWLLMPVCNGLIMGLTGFTLGKYLFGLKVVGRNGRTIGIGRSLLREYRVLVWGVGLHLMWPIVTLQRLAISSESLVRHGTAPWDAYRNVYLYRMR